MPTTILNPTSVDNPYDSDSPWEVLVGPDHVTAISDNDDATYIASDDPDQRRFSFRVSNTGLISPAASNIVVTLYSRSSILFPVVTFRPELRLGMANDASGIITEQGPIMFPQPGNPQVFNVQFSSAWTFDQLFSRYFTLLASRRDNNGQQQLCHKAWISVNWTAPIITAPGIPFAFNIGNNDTSIRIPLPASIPACSSLVPVRLTLFYTSNPTTAVWNSVVAAEFTQAFDNGLASSSTAIGQSFVDVSLSGLTKGTTYYMYAALSQLDLSSSSGQNQFTSSKLLFPAMTF